MAERELAHMLEHGSGLLGLAGTPDMPEVEARAEAGDPSAGLALDVYVHRLRAGVAGMVAALGGLDALVFTAGVGEHAARVRARTIDGLGFLGLEIDESRNSGAVGDTDITGTGARASVLVIRAREDLEIARQARAVAAAARG
jgi:acetate kinase